MTAPTRSLLSATGASSSRGLALAIFVLLVLITLPTGPVRDPAALLTQLACCVLGGLVVLRPLIAGTLLGIIVTALYAIDREYLGLAVITLPIVVAVAAVRGMRILALVYAMWYVTVSIAATARNVESSMDMVRAVDFWIVLMFAPLLLGDIVRRLQLRTERARREHAQAAERQRRAIARDLHDTLAYATTTMVMKAEQARLRGGHDSQTLSDLDFIATTGRSAAADLRTMVALLRDSHQSNEMDDDSPGMLPSNPLEEVVDAQRAKLAAFDFESNFALSGDPARLSERMSTVLARVLTEVASNITKHADPRHEVTLLIDLEGAEVEAVFVNSAKKEESDSAHRGMGLLGLQEIVTAEGGQLDAGPVGDRWITHLTLPRATTSGGRGDGGD